MSIGIDMPRLRAARTRRKVSSLSVQMEIGKLLREQFKPLSELPPHLHTLLVQLEERGQTLGYSGLCNSLATASVE